MIGINFKGPTKEETGESVDHRTAGVEPQSNWNDLGNWTFASLLDNAGATSAVSVTTNTNLEAYNSYVLIPSDNGNNYMMRGYIYPPSGSSMTVTVEGLEPPFTIHGYDVIVYFDGENGSADWVTQYTIGVDGTTVATVYGRDAKDTVQWDGTFVQSFGGTAAGATAGNYIRFTGLTGSGFTLTATPDAGSGPINAIQIVSVPEPASLALVVLGAVGALAARTRQSRFRR